MSGYLPRSERIDIRFPVTFTPEDEDPVGGQCINISPSGLLAAFDRPLDLWTRGALSLKAGLHLLDMRVRVARIQERDAGLTFAFQTDEERALVQTIVEFARTKTILTGSRPPF